MVVRSMITGALFPEASSTEQRRLIAADQKRGKELREKQREEDERRARLKMLIAGGNQSARVRNKEIKLAPILAKLPEVDDGDA